MAGSSFFAWSLMYVRTAGCVCRPARMPAVWPKGIFRTLWPMISVSRAELSAMMAARPRTISDDGSSRASLKPAPAVVPMPARNSARPIWRNAKFAE